MWSCSFALLALHLVYAMFELPCCCCPAFNYKRATPSLENILRFLLLIQPRFNFQVVFSSNFCLTSSPPRTLLSLNIRCPLLPPFSLPTLCLTCHFHLPPPSFFYLPPLCTRLSFFSRYFSLTSCLLLYLFHFLFLFSLPYVLISPPVHSRHLPYLLPFSNLKTHASTF